MHYTVLNNRLLWPSVLLILCSARSSEQESVDDVANAIGQIKNLIDTKLNQFELELNKMNTRFNNLDQQLIKINSRLDKLDQVELGLNNLNTRFNSLDQDIALIKDDTQLLFNTHDIITNSWEPLHLTCGVIGTFESCSWQHNNNTYQLKDIVKNRYQDLSVEPNTAANQQCDITIKDVESVHAGPWTCSVLTSSGKTLSGTKTVIIIPSYFEVFRDHVIRAPRQTDNSWSTSKRTSYQASLDRCTEMGAVPFVPKNKEDFDFMVHIAQTRIGDYLPSMWFPATDDETEGHLMWADNTDASSDASIIKWCKNNTLHDNTDNRDCAVLNYGGCKAAVKMEVCHSNFYPHICEILQP